MQVHVPLKEIMRIQTGFEDADFWLIRKGAEKVVGKPVKEYSVGHIGLKLNEVGRTLADPNYLYYFFTYIHSQGSWAQMAKGSTNLKHITVSDAKNFLIPIEVPDSFLE
jgi:hypothetical protein